MVDLNYSYEEEFVFAFPWIVGVIKYLFSIATGYILFIVNLSEELDVEFFYASLVAFTLIINFFQLLLMSWKQL